MFFRTTFSVVFQLPHDDIFRRREQDCLSCQDIRMHKQLDQVRFGHAEKYGAPLAQPAARTIRGVGSAGMRSCAGAWSNKACERLANAALASCAAALQSAQGWPVHPPT